jgi:hypothetical protein
MSRVRIHNFSISLDGFATGEGQALDTPFGHAGHRLHEWMFATRFGRREVLGESGGTEGVDHAMADRHGPGIGAEIMGAGKFGPPGWQDDPEWRGWWGSNPPFHTPTYVLTHRPRPSLEMEGGRRSTSSTPRRRMHSRWCGTQPQVRTSASAGARPRCARSSPPVSSTTCTSCRCRSCSAAVFGCGTAWRRWSSSTTWRQSRRRAASPTSRSPDDEVVPLRASAIANRTSAGFARRSRGIDDLDVHGWLGLNESVRGEVRLWPFVGAGMRRLIRRSRASVLLRTGRAGVSRCRSASV